MWVRRTAVPLRAPCPYSARALRPALPRLAFPLALVLGVLPLWVTRQLPMVDLPQHLHLISVLHRLDDPTTLYPELFAARGGFTPYLGYYHAVSALHWLLPLELANRVFLSAYVAGLALALAFLLRALGRPTWPALLALPFAYGDSFGWGFVNYLAALPLCFLTCGLFVRAVADAPRRRAWAGGLAAALLGVLLFHVQGFLYLALALPFLLLTTRAPEDAQASGWGARLRARGWALAGVAPGVAVFLAWAGARLLQPPDIQPGVPWRAWGPMFSPENLAVKSFAQNRAELPEVLANLLHDGTDRWAVWAVAAVAIAGWGLALWRPGARAEGPVERWRMPGLALLALALFFLLPFDIRGFVYYLNTRFAHPFAALAVASVPVVRADVERWLRVAALGCAVVLAAVLGRGFARFGQEAAQLDALVEAAGQKPRVMGLVYDWGSRVVRQPVFLHAAAVVARERGGVANFSFATTPHSPLRYRGEPPPTFPSEWNPRAFDYARYGRYYDHFLVRGAPPEAVLGHALQTELEVVARAGNAWLVRRRE